MTRLTREEFYDSLSSEYDDAILRCVPRYQEMLWAILRYIPEDVWPKRILDLGVGSGNLSHVMMENHPKATVVGVDISGKMLAVARERIPDERLELVRSDFRDLEFAEGSFDLVVSSISIHHVDDEDKQDLFRDIHRILRPGGVVAYSDQFRGVTAEIYRKHIEQWREESMSLGASREEWQMWMLHQDEHDHHSPILEQMAWLRAAGFTDIDCPWRYLLWTVLVARKPA